MSTHPSPNLRSTKSKLALHKDLREYLQPPNLG
jgi:hypothetical protein